MTRLAKMAHGRIFLARAIQCCPNIYFFKFIFLSHRLCIVKNMCVCVCVCVCVSACIETVCELPLLPNSASSETLLHKWGALRSVDWMFITGTLSECVTLDKKLYSLLFHSFFPIAFLEEAFIRNIYVLTYLLTP